MPVPICVRHYFLFLFLARAKHWMYVGGIPFVYSQSLNGKYVLSAKEEIKTQCFPHGAPKGVSHPREGSVGFFAVTHLVIMRMLL